MNKNDQLTEECPVCKKNNTEKLSDRSAGLSIITKWRCKDCIQHHIYMSIWEINEEGEIVYD